MKHMQSIASGFAFLQCALSRVTSGRRLIPAIDGLRCIAILAVVLYHLEDYVTHKHPHWQTDDYAMTWIHRVLHAGRCGVPMFFAISGFILGLPFIEARLGQRAPVVLSHYYWRRVTRLEPPYLINLVIMSGLLMIVKSATIDELWPHWLASAGYVHGFLYGTMSTINFVAWSLEVEVQFYLVAPVLAAVLFAPSRGLRRGLIGMVMGAIILAKISLNGPLIASWPLALPNYLDHFLIGLLLADIYATDWSGAPSLGWKWDALAICGWAGILATQLIQGGGAWLPLVTLVAFAGSLRGRAFHAILTQPAVVVTGGMCYTIYLYHFAIISAAGRFLLRIEPNAGYGPTLALHVLVMLPLILATSAMLFWLFEKPFMAWRGAGWPRWDVSVISTPASMTP